MTRKSGLSTLFTSPIFFGAVAGSLAVIVQLAYMPGKNAYGICTICHTRDLMAWLASAIPGLRESNTVTYLSWPVFTTLGLVLGSLFASVRNKEFRFLYAGRGLRMLILGILTAISGIYIMSCPTRLFLRLAYGDPFSVFGLGGMFLGIYLATQLFRRG